MRKVIVGVFAAIIAVMVSAGCNVKPETVSIIAQQAGLYSSVGWIALDNPSAEEIATVKDVLVVIEVKTADVEAGGSYTEVIYPEVVKYIDSKVKEQYRPLAKTGALSLLGGIDMLFVMNPEWKKDQEVVIKAVDAFILGAKTGLSMKEEDPIMIQARTTAISRAKVYKK